MDVLKSISEFENPSRRAFSIRYPFLKRPIIGAKRLYRNMKYLADETMSSRISADYLPHVISRHSSPLVRKLGDSDPRLQQQKIINLELAAKRLDGLLIPPGKKFSFWKAIGNPSYRNGYVDGMLLSEGKVVEGVGGGLCQMSNLLFWLFLHSPVEIVERFHHSRDAFPDSGRVLPFGCGATVFYNLIDLQIRNTTHQTLQLKIWLSGTQLKGQILGERAEERKFHVYEKAHRFIWKAGKFYRFNEIWRETLIRGERTSNELLFKNLAPVMYSVDDEYLKERNFEMIKLQ